MTTECRTPDKNNDQDAKNTLNELDFIEEDKMIDQANYRTTNNIVITPLDIVKKMKINDNSYIKDGKILHFATKNTIQKKEKITLNDKSDLYKEYFHLTFLSHKLNSFDFEPFIHVIRTK